jgi:hypothetical protein
VRVSNSHGSSLHNASEETRLFKATELAVQLSVTLRMKKLTVSCTAGSTHHLGDHVMAVPSGFLSDGFPHAAHTPRAGLARDRAAFYHPTACEPYAYSRELRSTSPMQGDMGSLLA